MHSEFKEEGAEMKTDTKSTAFTEWRLTALTTTAQPW